MTRRALAAAIAAAWLPFLACDGGGGDDTRPTGLTVSMTSTSPPPGPDVVWIAEGGRGGELLLVDILARDITQPFDAYEIELTFDPLLLEARSTAEGGALDACSALPILHTSNIQSGGAAGGTLLLSGVSSDPPGTTGCTVPGTRALARITFAAREAGTSALDFVPYNGDPNDPRGSRLFGTGAGMPVAQVTFFDSGASVTATR